LSYFYSKNECFLNAYLICLTCTRGSTIRGQSVRGSSLGWKDTFSIDEKGGEIYQMQRTEAWFKGDNIYQMQRIEAWHENNNAENNKLYLTENKALSSFLSKQEP
jgi:hypothetical protein